MNKWIIAIILTSILCITCLIGYAMHLHSKKPDVCQDSVEIRRDTQSEFSCHRDATLSYESQRAGGAFGGDNLLIVKCTCKK